MRPMNARRGDDGSSRDALKPLELRLDRHNMPLVLLGCLRKLLNIHYQQKELVKSKDRRLLRL